MNDGSLPALVKSIYYNSVTFIVVSRCYRHFFGIGILPVSDLLGGQNFGRYQNFGENHFFPRKGGRAPQKGGQCPPFEEKKGSTAPLLAGGSHKHFDRNQVFLRRAYGMYQYGKYQETPADTDRKIPI